MNVAFSTNSRLVECFKECVDIAVRLLMLKVFAPAMTMTSISSTDAEPGGGVNERGVSRKQLDNKSSNL
ncbi:unnamed protein product [Ixodes pacificus]